MPNTIIKNSKSSSQTQALGRKLGQRLMGGELLELTGDLGSGKTTFVKGLAEGLGVKGAISSPTFTISRVYEAGAKSLHHFDFYRIDSSDIVALELAESAADARAVVAVEWAERAEPALPQERLSIKFTSTGESSRQITLTAHGQKAEKLLKALK